MTGRKRLKRPLDVLEFGNQSLCEHKYELNVLVLPAGPIVFPPPPHSMGQEMADGLSVNVRLWHFNFSFISTDRCNFYSTVIWTLRLGFRVHGLLPFPWRAHPHSGNTPHCVALFRL